MKMDVKGRERTGEEFGVEVDETLEAALARREKHRERSVVVRAAISAAGFGIGVVAAPLSLVAPEFGLPPLLFALRILALEFDWAVRAYAKVAKFAKKVAGKLRKLWPKSKVGIAVTILVLVAVVYLAVFR